MALPSAAITNTCCLEGISPQSPEGDVQLNRLDVGLAINRSRVWLQVSARPLGTTGPVVHTAVYLVTKQYNLVPANGAVTLCGWEDNRGS